MKLYFIRHARTVANDAGLYCGSTNSNVSKNGKQLLLELKKEDIYPKNIDAFYTSKLIRTIETISILYPDAQYKSLEEFNEINFGEYEMQSHVNCLILFLFNRQESD